VAAVALFPTSVGAQTVAQSFDELQGMLKVGQIVFVTDETGRLIQGKVGDLSASSVTMLAPEKRTFGEGTVTRINRADAVWNGALFGLGVRAIPGRGLVLFTATSVSTVLVQFLSACFCLVELTRQSEPESTHWWARLVDSSTTARAVATADGRVCLTTHQQRSAKRTGFGAFLSEDAQRLDLLQEDWDLTGF